MVNQNVLWRFVWLHPTVLLILNLWSKLTLRGNAYIVAWIVSVGQVDVTRRSVQFKPVKFWFYWASFLWWLCGGSLHNGGWWSLLELIYFEFVYLYKIFLVLWLGYWRNILIILILAFFGILDIAAVYFFVFYQPFLILFGCKLWFRSN